MSWNNQNITKWACVLFALVVFDSLFTYLLSPYFGLLPVTVIPAALYFIMLVRFGKAVVPSFSVILWLVLAYLSFALGIFAIPEFGPSRLLTLSGAIVAFLAGYILFKYPPRPTRLSFFVMGLGGAYAIVGSLALLRVFPEVFPIGLSGQWALGGEVYQRPEITTDPNFQVFYVAPVLLGLVGVVGAKRFLIAAGLWILAAYTVAGVQSRSGALIFAAATTILLIDVMRANKRYRGRLASLIFIASGILVLVLLPIVADVAELMYKRLFEVGYRTGEGRLRSFLYLFEHLFEPGWWVPQGNSEFQSRSGGVAPHANVTAFFLEGGLGGLVFWIAVFLVPIYRLGVRWLRNELPVRARIAFFGALVMWVAQMSLNVPLWDQVWLWAGSAVYAEISTRPIRRATRPPVPQPDRALGEANRGKLESRHVT